jgi:hypothetical protein
MDSESDKLRNQINSLKGNNNSANNEDLARSINSLIKLFAEASEDMKMDTHDAVLVTQKLDKIIERLEKVEIQNEKIAKGIVALADMVEDLGVSSPLPRQMTSSRPSMPSRLPSSVPNASSPPPKPDLGGARPLPSYNLPKEKQEKKKPFLNFKM